MTIIITHDKKIKWCSRWRLCSEKRSPPAGDLQSVSGLAGQPEDTKWLFVLMFLYFFCIFATGLQIQNDYLYFVLSFVVDVFFYWSWSNWWRNLEVLKVRYNEGGRYWSFNSGHIKTPFPSSNIEILRVQLHYKCLSDIENDIEQR